MASLVLRFGLDDSVLDQINKEATRTLMPSVSRAERLRGVCVCVCAVRRRAEGVPTRAA